jgi:hypothetical protein
MASHRSKEIAMTTESVRDAAATTVIFGFFGFFGSAWFGWAQDQPPNLAAVGAAVLRARSTRDAIPAWIALVVGLHLFPVAAIIGYPLIHVIGALITAAALAAVPIARSQSLPFSFSATNGLRVGTALPAGAVFSLMTTL